MQNDPPVWTPQPPVSPPAGPDPTPPAPSWQPSAQPIPPPAPAFPPQPQANPVWQPSPQPFQAPAENSVPPVPAPSQPAYGPPSQPNITPSQPSFGVPTPETAFQPQPSFAPPPQAWSTAPTTPAQSLVQTQPWVSPPAPTPIQNSYQPNGFVSAPTAPQQQDSFLDRLRRLPPRTLALLGGIVVVLIAIILATQLIHGPITQTDVSSAMHTATNLDNDILDAFSTYNSMYVGSGSSDSTIATSVKTINDKLDDAQKQLKTLKSSAVQRDPTVNEKFKAYEAKLIPYMNYIQENTDDNSVLMPIFNNFGNKIQKAITNQPSNISQVSSYLTDLKEVVDSTSDQLNHITVKSDTNKRGVTALKTFLGSMSKIISSTRSDLNAHKDIFAIDNDIYKISDAEFTFDNAVGDINNEESANQKQLDPENAFSDMTSAIIALGAKTKS